MKNRKIKWLMANGVIAITFVCVVYFVALNVKAEQSPGTPESEATSLLTTLYDELETLTFGSDTDTPDWGTLWNRIKTAAKWTPTTTSTAGDVRSGKTFTATGTRETSTGTYPALSGCSAQQYHDSYGAPVTQTTNCTSDITWTTPSPTVTGDDKQDPRTGVIWSQPLRNNSGTVEFNTSSSTTWSWDGTVDADNIAVGGKTASQLCSERGNGWRLPTQKELMQAYIDGAVWGLLQPAQYFWTATEASAANAWAFSLNNAAMGSYVKSTSFHARCVR